MDYNSVCKVCIYRGTFALGEKNLSIFFFLREGEDRERVYVT
jgi:hypothetical protein